MTYHAGHQSDGTIGFFAFVPEGNGFVEEFVRRTISPNRLKA